VPAQLLQLGGDKAAQFGEARSLGLIGEFAVGLQFLGMTPRIEQRRRPGRRSRRPGNTPSGKLTTPSMITPIGAWTSVTPTDSVVGVTKASQLSAEKPAVAPRMNNRNSVRYFMTLITPWLGISGKDPARHRPDADSIPGSPQGRYLSASDSGWRTFLVQRNGQSPSASAPQ
jgi:hypothetical protein